MQNWETTDVVVRAPHMAVWHCKLKHRMLIHADQHSHSTALTCLRYWGSYS